MRFFIVVFIGLIVTVVCDVVPRVELKNKGYILKSDNKTCITTVDTSNYKYDLWFNDDNYVPEHNPHLICCNEPFSADTIIPSLGLPGKSSFDIIKMDFDLLTKGKTNCSIYYGDWLFGEIPATAFIPISGTDLTIHPITVRTLFGR